MEAMWVRSENPPPVIEEDRWRFVVSLGLLEIDCLWNKIIRLNLDRSPQRINLSGIERTHFSLSIKATQATDATIILWNTSTWKPIVRLAVHQLTVVRLVFSNSGRYLLSVSRDRSWSLFEIDETSRSIFTVRLHFHSDCSDLDFQARLFKRISSNNPFHKRIIWTGSFTHDDQYFFTGARDQLVHVWRVNEKSADEHEQPCEKNILKLNDSVTAIACAQRWIDQDKSVESMCNPRTNERMFFFV